MLLILDRHWCSSSMESGEFVEAISIIPLPLFQMNTSWTCNLVSYSKWSCFANLNFILDISIIKSSYIESLYLDVLRHDNK